MSQETPPIPPFRRVAILGVGLLGASLGLALKARKLAQHVTGVGRQGSPSLDVALRRGAIDEAFTAAAPGVRSADLVILCTPVRQFPAMLQSMVHDLAPGAVVTDVGSTKRDVMQWAGEILNPRNDVAFVGSHPMAGSEKRGPDAARPDLLDGAMCLICPAADAAATARVETLWKSLGMRTLQLSPPEHDRWVANVSHLPHAVAYALMTAAAAAPESYPAAAGGLFDTTRIAGSDVDMWTDIFLTNAQEVTAALARYTAVLAELRDAIAAKDEPALRRYLQRAHGMRQELLRRRQP